MDNYQYQALYRTVTGSCVYCKFYKIQIRYDNVKRQRLWVQYFLRCVGINLDSRKIPLRVSQQESDSHGKASPANGSNINA